MKITAAVMLCVFGAFAMAAQAPEPSQDSQNPSAADEEPKFKAIWEPVPFNKDVDLNAIACTGPDTCWVAGDKSTILYTADGGTTWTAQLGGDPQSTDDDLAKLFFLDAQHGWAMTDRGKLLGTTDGATWTELSTVSGTSQGVWFQTPQNGLEFENPDSTTQSTVQRSNDGGRSWTPASRCGVDASVGGLPRSLQCRLGAAYFVSPTIGFAGGSADANMSTSLTTFGKTTDGGHSWTMSVIPDSKRKVTDVNFWTDNDGIVVLENGEEVHWTSNGGAKWTRSVTQRLWPSVYGVGEGRIIVGIKDGGGIVYSFNGGRNFTSRPFALPASVRAVTFADAQHGYLVGDHAMVYRYRIVPIEYTAPGLIGAMAP
jgi:photosystem II stability/assembly factor-like uncharacterized protein